MPLARQAPHRLTDRRKVEDQQQEDLASRPPVHLSSFPELAGVVVNEVAADKRGWEPDLRAFDAQPFE